jgi:hypothetical protein
MDSGSTWTTWTTAGVGYWTSIASSSDGKILAAVRSASSMSDGGTYTSADSGETWTHQTSISGEAIASSSDGTKLATAVYVTFIWTGYYTPDDTTPDQFTFTAQTGVALSTLVTSNAIKISGINTGAPISITDGTYSINGGTYTSSSGTVVNGDTVWVQLTSSESYSTTTNATLTIGAVSDTFSVTTLQLIPVIPTPPTTGSIGGTITLNGSNFGTTQGSGYVDLNGVHGIIVSWSDTQIVVSVPSGATSGCLMIVTDYGTSDCIDFTVIADSLYANFTGAGIWQWNGTEWNQITSSNPTMMVASGTNLYGTFGSDGIWQWNGSAWNQLTASNPEAIVVSGTTLYGDFGENGIWKWESSSWNQITASNPTSMLASGTNLYGTFGSNGIWEWNGSSWNQLTASNPEAIVASGATLYGDFGEGGIWEWTGSEWNQITANNPVNMVTGN